MGRVVHFEIHAAEPARCAAFYAKAFGWACQEIPAIDYWTVETGEGAGISGGIFRRQGPEPADGQPVNAYVSSIAVADVDAAAAAVAAAGGRIVVPRFAIPHVGWGAYFKDSEGNIVGLHQADSSAR